MAGLTCGAALDSQVVLLEVLLFDPHLDTAGISAGGITLEHFADGRAFEQIRSTAPVREAGAVRCMGSLQGLGVAEAVGAV